MKFLSFRKPKDSVIDEYKTRCQALKEQTKYVEPPNLSSQLKLKSKSSLGVGDHVVREMNQIQDSKYAKSLRRDLLGISGNDPNNSLRQRVKGNTSGGSGEDMNEAMKHHSKTQEKIAEDMLALTRNLKEQTQIANRILRKDTEVSHLLMNNLLFYFLTESFHFRLFLNPPI